jgi:phage/plasmid-like protein (TIGR03299 family)
MAHEIESNDTIVLGSNTPAWHSLGKVFAGLLSPLRCYAEGVGARDIIEVPVNADGLTVDGFKGLIAIGEDGARTALGIVSKSYGVLKDLEFFKILENVYGSEAVVETAGTLRGGKRLWVLVKRQSWFVVPGDEIMAYDLWVNRHDGSGCFELHSTNVRVVCANTWKLALGKGRNRVFGVRHTTNVVTASRDAASIVLKARESEVFARAEVTSLTTKRITADGALAVYRTAMGVKEGEDPAARVSGNLDSLMGLFRNGTGTEGRTAWDAFNATTEFVDHQRMVRVGAGRDRAETRFETAVLGTGDDFKASVYDLLLSV